MDDTIEKRVPQPKYLEAYLRSVIGGPTDFRKSCMDAGVHAHHTFGIAGDRNDLALFGGYEDDVDLVMVCE
ncbi:hypothetical protein M422DRAFT_273269 [Sphaerobolus stellatus SS14]|uniref:Uncharacterized protein n=1 Tax=Sphaerobolus stellatus (strain SS14) TaxID=990650 RepID=A0A0C9T9K9_SPHS4|nr:hypothetical protein M422DRAFT_273269 [Sphaerobolus stellatus SS14]